MNSTLLILGSKQGQGPLDPRTLNEFDQSVVVASTKVPVAFITSGDSSIMRLKNQIQAQEAKNSLLANSSLGI
jgi:hypothetical protein